MIDRLQHPEEHQADAHAGGEQHREPADVAVLGFRLLSAQPDLAERRDDQHHADDDEDVAGGQEEPVEAGRQGAADVVEDRADLVLEGQRQHHESDDHQTGDQEYRIVDVQSEGTQVGLDVVLADLVVGLDDLAGALRRGDVGGFVRCRSACLAHLGTPVLVLSWCAPAFSLWAGAGRLFSRRQRITKTETSLCEAT